ncbi:MAG: major capsid protein [Rhizobiales bacterium]|nr:major capsid protein [Hyphomicrobiales bacterium]
MPMNNRQAAVIDPLLTKIVLGYTNSEFIGHEFFPDIEIKSRRATIITFGMNNFHKIDARRAPGADVKRIGVGFDSGTVSLVQDALEGMYPIETADEAMKIPRIDLGEMAATEVMDILLLNREIEKADKIQNLANYSASNKATLSGTDKWGDAASDPVGDILEAREAIRRKIGRYPNKMGISPDVLVALRKHPKIAEQFKYTSSKSITLDMLAGLFEVEKVVVGKAIYKDEDAAETDEPKDIWDNSAWLAYVPSKILSRRTPSFGYHYKLKGHPNVEVPYYWKPNKSWIYPVTFESQVVFASPDAGFLFNGVTK